MDQPRGRARSAGMSLYSAAGSRKYLTTAERRRFFRALRALPPRERLFFMVAAWSGGRISEVLALTADSIDLDNGTAALETLKRRRRGIVRHVPIPPTVLRQLARTYRLSLLQRDAILARQRLWPWSRVTAWRRIKAVMVAAGIHGSCATAKGLRHTFGVTAFEAGVPPHLVQRWLGHASLRTTAIYGEVVGPEELRIASRMWRR